MNFSRRRFVVTTGSAALFLERATAESDPKLRPCLAAWIDTLYPADETCPAATELGVDLAILEKAQTVRNYTELLRRGTNWADEKAALLGKTSFMDLDEAGREKIVAQAEAMDSGSVPGMFFLHTVRDGAFFYYGHEECWPAVGFPRPPQPAGFLDYTERPSE